MLKFQFKHLDFQEAAAKAVVDVFTGQPYHTSTYRMDRGVDYQQTITDDEDFTGWRNEPLELTDKLILENLQKVQHTNQLKPSTQLYGKYNLTIEMETGVGKTYTYIKTMYELNKHYGWSKFIVVVPSIAIREGVYKSFQVTQNHFAEEYKKKIKFFIYNSSQLTDIDHFASDNSINVMIINSQAFNAKGKDSRRIFMVLDEFHSRRPIDIIAETNPILIIDEPQSVEGKMTKEQLKKFNPLITLRYSATHKADSIYNMVYRLDAMDAYNKKLVKKIEVKGIEEKGAIATDGYVYLKAINVSKEKDPTATIEFDCKRKNNIVKKTMEASIGFSIYNHSENLDEYKNHFVVKFIDGRDNSVELENGIKICVGEVIGKVSEDDLRRIQIHETILSHIEREKQLLHEGIKVLSLFFIDKVEKYKRYDEDGNPHNGIYADMFEEEYNKIVDDEKRKSNDKAYMQYLNQISAHETHAGYFSIDKKGKMTDSKVSDKNEKTSDDINAYDLIMRDKETLLDCNPQNSPVRFIFSHSALREGWDNPNVFQICTLKQSSSEVRKRQEVGRGLRLCVNQTGERMDASMLGDEVHNINVLTVIASESYERFAEGLQKEMADSVVSRPKKVDASLFDGQKIVDNDGNNSKTINSVMASCIVAILSANKYIDDDGNLTETYYNSREKITFNKYSEYSNSIQDILDGVYNWDRLKPNNSRENNVILHVKNDKLQMDEFIKLWEQISPKSSYFVSFDTHELIEKSIKSLDNKLEVTKIRVRIQSGSLEKIESREKLIEGTAFTKGEFNEKEIYVKTSVKYDLLGKLVYSTGLRRQDIAEILNGIKPETFKKFSENPEEFIIRASNLINDEKATVIVQHIKYEKLPELYSTDIFAKPEIKGKLNSNAMKVNKHLYDYLIYDSDNERKFASNLDNDSKVALYVKLPKGFYISTPIGRYTPDWAIAFYEGQVKHIYFVAETKGSMSSLQLREIENSKIECAKKHFEAISGNNVFYDVVDNYDELLNKVLK